jgi:hypothetical protein
MFEKPDPVLVSATKKVFVTIYGYDPAYFDSAQANLTNDECGYLYPLIAAVTVVIGIF